VRDDAERIPKERSEVEIVIAAQVVDFDPGAAEVVQGGQHAEVALGDEMAVLHPELEDVAEEEEVAGIAFKSEQELFEKRFTIFLGPGVSGAQMQVGDEDRAVGEGGHGVGN
jgi:hypothetical protein